MWLLAFALVLQVVVILELVLNRIISVVCNAKRNPLRKLADGSFCGSLLGLVMSVLTIPVSVGAAAAQLFLNYFFFWVGLLLVIAVLAVLSETSSALIVIYVNAYNSGVGQALHEIVVFVFELFAPLWRAVVPLWNALVYMVVGFWVDVLLPIVFVNAKLLPDFFLNFTVLLGSLGGSVYEWFTRVNACTQHDLYSDNASSPFWVNDLSCVGNAHYLTVDLMTPSLYAQRTAITLQEILTTSCVPVTNLLTLGMYPLLDINLYKVLHGLVNAVLHAFVSLPVITYNRCSYGQKTTDYTYTDLEKQVMCTPDVTAFTAILVSTFRSAGALIDNWLDTILIVAENSVTGVVRSCAPLALPLVWQNASDVLGTSEMQVVGLTPSMYAITDADSVVYHSMVGASLRVAYALHAWPFKIDLRFGVAAVSYNAVPDLDDEGDGRTGMLGCRCVDIPDQGMQVMCASVPFQHHLAEDENQHIDYTVHRVRFVPDSASFDLRCAQVSIRVVPLRFSRRRFSAGGAGRVEFAFDDQFNTRLQTGARTPVANTVDAAIIVTPLCAVQSSVLCVPSIENCFPFCMGLHAAGQRSQNISLMNAARWDEWTSLGQTDCVVGNAVASECDVADKSRLLLNEDLGVRVSGCAATACSPDTTSVTFVKNSNEPATNRSLAVWTQEQKWGFVRSAMQPFVAAGDVFLFRSTTNEVSGQIVVTRLYDNKRGDFSLQQEKLSLLSSSLPLQYHQCLNEQCYTEQLRENHIVLPADYFIRENPSIATASEWAVHWTATPSSAHCALVADFCAHTTRDESLMYAAHRPRLWTLRTMRHTGSLGMPFSQQALASYMIIPDWFSCSMADFLQKTQCSRMYNMKVTGLEYINADNLLLTVLAAMPGDWDWRAERVLAGRPFQYRFYFVHPNRHDCTDADAPETMYTCWREAEDGPFAAPPSAVSETGALCPMLQRMPKWGSMLTEIVVSQVYLLKVLLDALLVMPLIVRGDAADLFERHTRPTFHSMLDGSGNGLFELEDVLQAMQLAAFHAANTIARAGALMQTLGVPELETVLVGTARVFELTTAASMVEDRVLGGTVKAVSGPHNRLTSMFASSTTQEAPMSSPGTPMSLSSQGSTRWVTMFQSIAGPSVSWTRITVKIMRKILVKALRSRNFLRLVARDMTSTIITSVYDSDSEISRGLFDNMKTICDASGQIVGRTNSWGQSVRHACMLVPESLQAVIRVVLILTVDYQVMDCVCKQTESFVVEDVLNNVCLPRILPMARKAFVMQAIADRSTSGCFAVMDSVNDRFLRVFDPVFSRMVKTQAAIESAFGLLVTQAMGVDSLSMKCMEYDSPFVVSVMPEPVDYFMGCMHTFDCRARCLDTMQAFDDSLRTYAAYTTTPPAYVTMPSLDIESRYFSYADMELDRHLEPFAVYAVVQMPPSICLSVCPTQQARCVAVGGIRLGALAVAYYCVPASIVMSVYEGVALQTTADNETLYNDDILDGRLVIDMHFATVYKRMSVSYEWMVVLTRDHLSQETAVWLLPGGVAKAAWQLLETQAYNPATFLKKKNAQDAQNDAWAAENIDFVHVLPAHEQRPRATIFVIGSTRTADGLAEVPFCIYFLVETDAETHVDTTKYVCRNAHTAVHSTTHSTVCVDYDCTQVVRIPLTGDTEVRLETLLAYTAGGPVFDWTVTSTRIYHMPSGQRNLLDIDTAVLLSPSQDLTLQYTRRTLSPFGSVTRGSFQAKTLSIDIPLTGRGQKQDTWLQNVRVKIEADALDVKVAASFTTAQRVQIVVNCSITSCVGCHGTHPLAVDLQNKCFAAASCGIAKCVGTPVNMKRPMCQMASLLGLQMVFARVNMQSFWDFFSRSIIMIVELSQSRRKLYEITTPQETTMATVCSAKDGIVQSLGLFGALYAQIPAATLDIASREPLSLQEIRYNTQRVMVATAVVEFLSQIALGVVYVPLVSSKMMQCQLNDAFLVVEGVATTIAEATTNQDIIKFRMGNKKFDKINDYAVGVCLTDKSRQDMSDIADPAREQSINSGLQDIIDGVTGLITTSYYGNIAYTLDAIFAWALGILTGFMNLLQVIDSDHCRLPATDTLLVGTCVCGDTPARIPQRQRSSKRIDALWCRGPLMMTSVIGNDVLVWNPYSLTELLAQNTVQKYFDCLGKSGGAAAPCSASRPTNDVFEAQGVDILQIIIRCRSNYQQKRWDDGALALGLLEHAADWLPAVVQDKALVQMYGQAGNSFETLRKRLAQISLSVDGVTDLDESTWSCLRVALFSNEWNHNCAELALANGIFDEADSLLTYFEYGVYEVNGKLRDDAALFANADACESFSGGLKTRSEKGVTYPRMAWDGDSKNTVPVAELHNKLQGNDKARIQQAEAAVAELVRSKIQPAFAAFTNEALRDIETQFWSLEGDSIHQAVDCMMLGPYAAADMLPTHKTLANTFRTPQYHRGNPDTREIMYGLRTQGSAARQKIMQAVVKNVANTTDTTVRDLVVGIIEALRKAYTTPQNLYCTCLGTAVPSTRCCITNTGMHSDLAQFATTFSAQTVLPRKQNMHAEFTASVVNAAIQTKLLEEIWYDQSSAIDVLLSDSERIVLANLYAFGYDEPVREYSANEVPQRMNKTLWAYCVESLEAVFFTMPMRVDVDGSATVDADTTFDPLSTTEADASKYLHGMERAIETILDKAKLHSPTYWSHVHRYMPSDSVWCEETTIRPPAQKRNATYPEEWNNLRFRHETVAAPTADELLYVARLGSTCVCGLSAPGGACAVPPGLCQRVPENTTRWADICSSGTYSSSNDAFLVRLALYRNDDLMATCAEAQPSTSWGLLDSLEHRQWYNGSTEPQNVSLHEIAARGPAGVRLGMFVRDHDGDSATWKPPTAPAVNLDNVYNEKFEHTIAQPICHSSQHILFKEDLAEYFRDVLFPMAHAVHEAPSQVICGRWVVEYAMYVSILSMSGATSTATAQQRIVEEIWRARCTYQLEIVGLCQLRNVYSLVPPGTQNASHCKFTVAPNACGKFYVTGACLLMCDGQLYDPCSCENAQACATVFTKQTCLAGRRYKPLPSDMSMDSLHWARSTWPANQAMQRKLDAFHVASFDKRLTLPEEVMQFLREHAARDEGVAPSAFCDELLDYMDEHSQHPVGYHPTCACERDETNMRGFDSWMSVAADSQHGYSIDPVRLRNMSMYTTTFGAAHLACDASAYSASGAQLNSFRMQSKWNDNARADPAMPVYADMVSEQSMKSFGSQSDGQHDTPLQADVDSDALFRHSVGLVRDWLRDYESEEDQAALDALWPHWLDTAEAQHEAFAAPTTGALRDGCNMPLLLRCYENSDCSSSDSTLRCQKNEFYGADSADTFGICVDEDTCFQHAHCDSSMLCSGRGRCELPEIIVHNTLPISTNVRMFAKDSAQCTGSAFGSSVFQRVPTFARDNGLCSVHNLFNYRNITDDVAVEAARASIKSIGARIAQFIPDALLWLSIADEGQATPDSATRDALRMHAHPCDREYEHTDYKVCLPHGVPVSAASTVLETHTFASTRTWRREDGSTKVDFCKLHVGGGVFNTLTSPYMNYDDDGSPTGDLLHTETTIRRCDDFHFCPAQVYTVGGINIERLFLDTRGNLLKYPLSYAAQCMSFGLWDGTACRVDTLVVPLVRVLFADVTDAAALAAPFDVLRLECPAAFGAEYADALDRFQSTYWLLSQPYNPSNALPFDLVACERMTDKSVECIAYTINKLMESIFDLQHQTRGIKDLPQYKIRARCTTHVYARLQDVQLDNAQRMHAFAVPTTNVPGLTYYMFTGSFPVEVPMSWFWKCVLLAPHTEGGAQPNWFTLITNPQLEDSVQCPNIMLEGERNVKLRAHLQRQSDIYDSQGDNVNADDVFDEILEIMADTIDKWDITSIPTLLCRQQKQTQQNNDCTNATQYSYLDKVCWDRLANNDMKSLAYNQVALTYCTNKNSDLKCTLYDVMFHFLFGRSSKRLRENTVLTVQWMVETKIAIQISLDTMTSPVFSYADMIPEIEFAKMMNLTETLINSNRTADYSVDHSSLPATCSNVLPLAEYEFPSRIIDNSVSGEYRMYRRIRSFKEMAAAQGEMNEEVYEYYDIFNETSATKHVAISQKQMLLLALYRMREVMYLGVSQRFGTMRYIPAVRAHMQRERVMAQDFAARVNLAKEYDIKVKMQNYQCPDKTITQVAESDVQKQLKECLQDLKEDVGWTVKHDQNLILHPDAHVLLRAFYVTFAEAPGMQFLDELVETEWHKKQVTRYKKICFTTPEGAAPLMPLWSGMLDLQSCPNGKSCGCQLSASQQNTLVDLTCDRSPDMQSCESEFPTFYRDVKRGMYEKCWLQQGDVVSVSQYEQMDDGNLCNRQPAQAQACSLAFGAQGRVKGRGIPDLHSATAIANIQAGLFTGNSTLFRGAYEGIVDRTTVTALQLLQTDIGGHSLKFRVREVGSGSTTSAMLDLVCVSAGKSCVDEEFSTWFANIQYLWTLQHSTNKKNMKLGPRPTTASATLHWQCPLQWLTAYSDLQATFTTRSPSAERNRVRFRHITGDREYAHATVTESLFVAQHPARFLSDRTACVDAVIENGKLQFRCKGRTLLLDALDTHRGRWSPAVFVLGNTPNCKSKLDWPHKYVRTVDGHSGDTTSASMYCNVFWRLPSFALRYVAGPAQILQEKTQDTPAAGSACRMGRLSKVSLHDTDRDTVQFCTKKTASTRCRMLRRNDTAAGGVEHSWHEREFVFEPAFTAKRRPASRERKCSTCDRHDTASFVDRRARETPLSNKVRQLSVGEPTTVSVERLLAAALRRLVCPAGPKAPCPALYNVFNQSTWRRGRLLDEMLARAIEHQQKDALAPSDDELWAAPWVLCQQVQNETSCSGTISKAEWRDPATRLTACVRETNAAVSRNGSSLDFCLLSDETAALCTKVVDWNSELTHILCAAGNNAKCTPRAFYYNPSQYSISNKDFVYRSVASLYTKLNSTACPQETQQQQEQQNQEKVHLCASYHFNPLVAIIKLVRLVARKLAMAGYYAIQVIFSILGVVVSYLLDTPGTTADYFVKSLSRFVHLLLITLKDALESIWKIAWTLLDFGDFSFIKNMARFACQIMQGAIVPIIENTIVPFIQMLITCIEGFNRGICAASFGTNCEAIPVKGLGDTYKNLMSMRQDCEQSNPYVFSDGDKHLPVATKCWATYNTYYGDSGRLSCTPADTCRAGLTDFSLNMCGNCEALESHMPFGCSDITKTCTCNLPVLAEQGCLSNEECAAPDATCRYIDSDLEPSVGFTQCASCQTKRVCLLTAGRSQGYCACGLVDIELQRCVTQSKPTMTSFDKLCIYTQDYSFLRTTSYVFSFYTSITAPCNQLNPSSTFCARESSDGQLYAVGVDTSRRRHLLGIESAEADTAEMAATDTQNSLCKDALSSDFMPAQRSACRAAYRYSKETLLLLDLPWPLPPCTFCSVEDVMQSLLLQPQNLVMIATNVSRLTHVLARHSPLRVLFESARRLRKDMQTALEIASSEPALQVAHVNGSWHVHVLVDMPNVAMLARVLSVVLVHVPPPANNSQHHRARRAKHDEHHPRQHSRNLLTVEDVSEAVQQNFRVSAALRQAFAAQLASSLDYTFESPASQREWANTWPPKLGTAVLVGNLCPPLTNMLRTTSRALRTIDESYSMQKQAVPVESVDKAWLNVTRRSDVNVSWADYGAVRAAHDPITSAALFVADRCLAVVSLSPSYIYDLLAAAADELWTFIKCDYEAMQTCSKWRAHVLVSSVVVALYFVGVYILFAAVGLGMPVILAAVVLPSVVLYMSYGYAPLCFPAVPVCLYDDLVYSLQLVVPKSIQLPSALYKNAPCMAAAASTPPRLEASCLRTCTDEPFAYIEWYDVLSWWLLEIGFETRFVQLVQQPWLAVFVSQQTQDDIQAAVAFHTLVFHTPDADLITTNRVCAVVSLYKLIPFAALLLVCVMLALGAVQTALLTATVAFQVTFALFLSAFY